MRALLAALLLATTAHAQDAPPKGFTTIEPLWPAGHVPLAHGEKDIDTPRLYCYPAPGPGPHAAVVVLPGGGYNHVVLEKEGGAEARWLQEHGVSAYVLYYRMGKDYLYPVPLMDGARAVRYVRAHAKAWDLRPDAIGVWGFSAGGHMAGYLATIGPHEPDPRMHPEQKLDPTLDAAMLHSFDEIDRASAHPDFAIFSYARLSLDPVIPGTFGMKGLIGDNPSKILLDYVDPILHVTKETSPSFLYSTTHDATVSPMNPTLFYNALLANHVDAELHIFELGPHGTGMGQNLPKLDELAIWPTLLQHWLQLHNWMPATP